MPGYWNDDQGGGQAPPSYPVSPPSGGHPGGWVSEPSETFSTPPPTQTPVDTSGGDSGFTSDTTTNPYYTTEGTFIPEQKPIPAPSDFMVGNVIADALAAQSVNPGYAKSWDYNPKNPERLGTYDNEGRIVGQSPTLGKIFAVDRFGDPVMDSSGNPIKTNYGTDIIKYVQDQLQEPGRGAIDLSLYGAKGPTGFFENILSPEELRDYQDTWWRDYGDPGGGGYGDWGDRDYSAEREARQQGLFYGPRALPQREMEQQGFFNTLGSKIRNPFLEAVGETLAINPEGRSGLYGKTVFHPKMRKPWGLEKEYATGTRSPLYENRARGGIISAWENRR